MTVRDRALLVAFQGRFILFDSLGASPSIKRVAKDIVRDLALMLEMKTPGEAECMEEGAGRGRER